MATASPTRESYTLTTDAFTTIESHAQAFVRDYMSRYDPSHDYHHIERVSTMAQHLSTVATTATELDHRLITLAALLHDVGDHKYLVAGETPNPTPVKTYLLSIDAPAALAESVQILASNVSFSNETKSPEDVQKVLKVYPELAFVQDADRLDALGAVGIARTFAFGASKRPEEGMDGPRRHFDEKLVKLGTMMKTEEGKRVAARRTERIKTFARWWDEEVGLTGGESEGEGEKETKWKVEDSYNVGTDDF